MDAAQQAYQTAVDHRRGIDQEAMAVNVAAHLATLALEQGNPEQALTHIETVLAHIDEHGVGGMDYPLQVYLECFQVLWDTANGNEEQLARATEILTTAHTKLQEEANQIRDEDARATFLQNVPYNRDIVAAWAAL